MRVPKLLMIDNFDSFTFNLVQMFRQYPLEVVVFRSDSIDVEGAATLRPDYIVISPGPKEPAYAGVSMELIRAMYRRVPTLGVCLGMQCINEVFGGQTVRSPQPLHGKTSAVFHQGRGLFMGLPSPFKAARYHSLVVELCTKARPDALVVTAKTDNDIIMGLSHADYPLHGIQFHPESFLTSFGFGLVENFLKLGPLENPHDLRLS
jgi:anthranilate synthase component 2